MRFATEEAVAKWEQPEINDDVTVESPPAADLPIIEYIPSDTGDLAALLDADIAEIGAIEETDTDDFWFPPADTSEWVHALREATDGLWAPALNGHSEAATREWTTDDLVNVESAPAMDDILDSAVAELVARVEGTESAIVDMKVALAAGSAPSSMSFA